MEVRLHSVLVPTLGLGADLEFYQGLLGRSALVVDGDRYAALPPTDGIGVALAAGGEAVASATSLVLRTDDLDAALVRVEELGGSLLTPPADGPHERRAVVADPSGNPLVLSQKREHP
jgi:predicted enzyme related to lactoylglutathione lyase